MNIYFFMLIFFYLTYIIARDSNLECSDWSKIHENRGGPHGGWKFSNLLVDDGSISLLSDLNWINLILNRWINIFDKLIQGKHASLNH